VLERFVCGGEDNGGLRLVTVSNPGFGSIQRPASVGGCDSCCRCCTGVTTVSWKGDSFIIFTLNGRTCSFFPNLVRWVRSSQSCLHQRMAEPNLSFADHCRILEGDPNTRNCGHS
jgi:hypothetical protein